jgi:WD40 repeat protein
MSSCGSVEGAAVFVLAKAGAPEMSVCHSATVSFPNDLQIDRPVIGSKLAKPERQRVSMLRAFSFIRFLTSMLLLAVAISRVAHAQIETASPVISALAISPAGDHVVIGSQKGCEIRKTDDLSKGWIWKTELEHIHDLAFSPDGSMVLLAGGSPSESGSVECRRWPSGEMISNFESHDDLVYHVAWSSDGQQFATASADGLSLVFHLSDSRPTNRFEGHSQAVLSIVFLPGDKLAVSCGIDQSLRIWEVSTAKLVRTLIHHNDRVTGLAVKPQVNLDTDSTGQPRSANAKDSLAVLASIGDDRTVRIWQPTTGRLVRFAKLSDTPCQIAWSSTGQQLYVGCKNGTVFVFASETLKIEKEWKATTDRLDTFCLSRNDQGMVVAQRDQLYQFDFPKD